MEHDQEARPTIAEIDGSALAHNFRELTRIAAPARVLPVIKSNAYGHGLLTVARVLRDAGADRFAVATAEEGWQLRAAGIDVPILVLGGIYPAEFARAVAEGLTPVVWDAATVTALASVARSARRALAVHVKIDTGMSRLGVSVDEAVALIETLRGIEGVMVEGVMTHFCYAESVGGAETVRQLERFSGVVAALESKGLRPSIVHAANSAATLTAPQAHFDRVRPGLALYGIHPSDASRAFGTLRPVMRLRTRIIALRSLPAGTGVSYGATFVTARPSRIATLPAGYADGYPRALSNCGVAIVRGERVPIAGRVCMDQTMVDVTDVPAATCGDEVELWGPALPVEEAAAIAGTIPYELVARVASRVPRRLV